MPYNVKIDWVRDIDREAFIKEDGTVLVRLGYSHGQLEKSLVLAMMAFCSKALIPLARPYLGESLVRTLDLYTVRKMLNEAKTKGSMDYFLNDVFTPEIKTDASLGVRCQTMENLDRRGMYTRILLRQLEELGQKLYPAVANGSTVLECDNFVLFLKQIAEKAPDEDVELAFRSRGININVMLVAKRDKIGRQGYPPYLDRIKKMRKKGIETMYLCGLGINIDSTKAITNIVEKNGSATIISSEDHIILSPRGKSTPAVCIILNLAH